MYLKDLHVTDMVVNLYIFHAKEIEFLIEKF